MAAIDYRAPMTSVLTLLPLQTLPSWPAVPDMSLLHLLTLTVFIPLAIAAVITVLVMGPAWRAKEE